MSENNLINLGELARPAEVLVQRFCDGVGGVFKPWQIRRVAKAEADREVILAEAEIRRGNLERASELAKSDIGERAIARLIESEVRSQINMESILSKAIECMKGDEQPEKISNSFTFKVFESCKTVDDPALQELWGKIISGEARTPGTVSRRTIDIVSTLEAEDAKLFTEFSSFCYGLGSGLGIMDVYPMLTPSILPILEGKGIGFDKIQHLVALGLVHFNDQGFKATFERKPSDSDKTLFVHGVEGVIGIVFHERARNELQVGKTLLTKAGKELAPKIGAPVVDGVFELLACDFMDTNRSVFSPYKPKT